MIILDMETDGLLDTLTKIHCAVLRDVDTMKIVKEFTPNNIEDLIGYLDSVSELSCHNGIGFDLKVLKKLYNYEYKGKYIDTLLCSRMLWPDIEPAKYYRSNKLIKVKNKHSVESWGLRFNVGKPEHEDWNAFSLDMLHRCKEDTKIQALLYKKILEEIKNKNFQTFDKVISFEQKVWQIMEQQAENGWLFDIKMAKEYIKHLEDEMATYEAEIAALLPIKCLKPYKDSVCKAFKTNGELTTNAAKWVGDYFEDVVGDFSRVSFEKIDINSSKQLKSFLLDKGWVPKEWNYKTDQHKKPVRDEKGQLIKTSPQLPKTLEQWEEVTQVVDNEDIIKVAEYNKCRHAYAKIKGLIKNCRPDNRLEARAISCATNTARMVHRVVTNIPKVGAFFGDEMRGLFQVSESRMLVGCDASALEARCEAHYIYPYDPDSAMELIEGDIHTKNANIFQVERQKAKSGKYAITYGCSPSKLAATIGKPINMAKDLYEAYWDGNPGLKELKKRLEKEFEIYGFVRAIDGRPLSVRYKHALINILFQSCGSIIMKVALIILDKLLKNDKMDARFVGNFHDEIQMDVKKEHAEQVARLAEKSLVMAGKALHINVPIIGESKIGINWAETH